jgi:Deoxyribodipyrimidine photolyase
MQSGVTGINSIRIYNPVKQQRDHDPEGVFVKMWVPELKNVPNEYIFTPHLMSDNFQEMHSVKIDIDYPAPIVNHDLQAKKAKNILYGIKGTKEAKDNARKIYLKHGSRRKRKNG